MLEKKVVAAEKTSAGLQDETMILKNETMTLEKNVDMLNTKVEAIKESLSQ